MRVANRKAKFNYKLESERFEAGISLEGSEAKAFRTNKVDLANAHARIIDDEVWLINANISGAKKPTRMRKLLLKKSQIVSISTKMKQKRLTFVPVSMYTTGHLIKVKLALGKTKKKFEKRENLRKKAIKRQIEQEIKK